MYKFPPGALDALQSNTPKITFVRLALKDATSLHICNADESVVKDGVTWAACDKIDLIPDSIDPRLKHLDPLPSKIDNWTRVRRSSNRSGETGIWQLIVNGESARDILELSTSDGDGCDIDVWQGVTYDHGKWFSMHTCGGRVVLVSNPIQNTVSTEHPCCVIDCVDSLSYYNGYVHSYSTGQVVKLITHLMPAPVNVIIEMDDEQRLMLMVTTPARVWVVGRSYNKEHIHRVRLAVNRVMVRTGVVSPGTLYKYINHAHVQSFLDGCILISPAERFKDSSVESNDGRADDEISKTTGTPEISEIVAASADVHGASTFDIENRKLELTSSPYWLWCASTCFHIPLLNEFKDTDVIIEITDPVDFYTRLLNEGRKRLDPHLGKDSLYARMVDYESHLEDFVYGTAAMDYAHPSVMKHRRFEHQQEFRCVWMDPKHPPEPDPDTKGLFVKMGDNHNCAHVVYRK